MKLVAFTALLSVLLLSSTVYLIMDQSKTELMNLLGNSEKFECLYLDSKKFQQYIIHAVNTCETPKRFILIFTRDHGKTKDMITTNCVPKNKYAFTGFDGEEIVLEEFEEDC